jgi:hypothetical protein
MMAPPVLVDIRSIPCPLGITQSRMRQSLAFDVKDGLSFSPLPSMGLYNYQARLMESKLD